MKRLWKFWWMKASYVTLLGSFVLVCLVYALWPAKVYLWTVIELVVIIIALCIFLFGSLHEVNRFSKDNTFLHDYSMMAQLREKPIKKHRFGLKMKLFLLVVFSGGIVFAYMYPIRSYIEQQILIIICAVMIGLTIDLLLDELPKKQTK